MPRDDGNIGYGVVEKGLFGRGPLGWVMTCIVAQLARESGYDVVCVCRIFGILKEKEKIVC